MDKYESYALNLSILAEKPGWTHEKRLWMVEATVSEISVQPLLECAVPPMTPVHLLFSLECRLFDISWTIGSPHDVATRWIFLPPWGVPNLRSLHLCCGDLRAWLFDGYGWHDGIKWTKDHKGMTENQHEKLTGKIRPGRKCWAMRIGMAWMWKRRDIETPWKTITGVRLAL